MEKHLDIFQPRGESVIGQAIEKDLAITLLGDAIIQQHQHAAVPFGPDQPSRSLLQRDTSVRDLVVVKRISSCLADGLDSRIHHGIIGHRERQLVDNYATKLFSWDVHTLPK